MFFILIPQLSFAQYFLNKQKINWIEGRDQVEEHIFFSEDSTYGSVSYTSNDVKVGFYLRFDANHTAIGTWTKSIDTFNIGTETYIFSNPFPHVYMHSSTSNSNTSGPKPVSTGGFTITFDKNGDVKGSCILNDSIGTLVYYWWEKKLCVAGHFWDNEKNGKWQYWNEEGKLFREEWYDKGKLLREEEY
jgi:hypothetical protein